MAVFQENISNEEVAALPLRQFGGRMIVVRTAAQAEEACRYLATCKTIGFDTETRPTFKAGALNKVALLQLSTDDRCYLFRLSGMALEKSILCILENNAIVKVGADVKGDLRALQMLRFFTPRNFLDLQSIVGKYGILELSVRKMAAIVLGVRVSKAQRLSNWEAHELTQAQMLYAATDAWITLKIYQTLKSAKI